MTEPREHDDTALRPTPPPSPTRGRTAPARRSDPLIVAVSLAVTVAMALLVLWQWADARRVATADPPLAAGADPAPAPATPVLSFRRAPAVLLRSINVGALRAGLQPLLDRVAQGSCAVVAVDGEVVAAANAALPVIPASTAKLVVGAVALERLGPGYRFRTSVVGEVGPGGVVAGDLVLVGGGDPVLSTAAGLARRVEAGDLYPPIHSTPLEQLADAVVAAGVTRVEGRLLGDASRYDDEWFNPTWAPELRGLEAGPLDALLVDDARVGGALVRDPALAAAEVFAALLRDRGVAVAGGAGTGIAPSVDPLAEVAAIESAPLSDVVHELLETSDDNTAELLVKELGVVDGAGGTTAEGLAVVRDQLTMWGAPLEGVTLVDGSGLSRDNRLTCATLVAVLQRDEPDGPLGAGLPVAAETGTLAPELAGSPVAGRLRAKTGRLTGVRGLAGYLPTDGGVIELALVLNEPGAQDPSVYRPVWDQLAVAIAAYPAAATPAQLAPR